MTSKTAGGCLLMLFAVAQLCAAAKFSTPLKTSGRYIVDSKGSIIRLKCASWSGGQEKWHAPSGLWAQHRDVIAGMAKKAGLNCIRLLWTVESVLDPGARIPAEAFIANPDLVGKTPLQVMDAMVAAVAKQGMMVVLDNHSSDAMWCCSDHDGNGLWYTNRWSEQQWLKAWRKVAIKYANNTAVIGMGLRNEPRPTVVRGNLRLPTWGTNDKASDIALAYEKAASLILGARPTYLIFAQGMPYGRDLIMAGKRPIRLRLPNGRAVTNQLVYEVHEYPWHWDLFGFNSYDTYATLLDARWGYLVRRNITPVWIGEIGCYNNKTGLGHPWWGYASRYIRELELGWSWWPLDGQVGASRPPRVREEFGMLNTTWNGYAYQPLLQQLALLDTPYPSSRSISNSPRSSSASSGSGTSRQSIELADIIQGLLGR